MQNHFRMAPNTRPARALPRDPAVAKASPPAKGHPRMQIQAVVAILIFVAVLAALNRYEFGRFD